jgi:hypothetical protein
MMNCATAKMRMIFSLSLSFKTVSKF